MKILIFIIISGLTLSAAAKDSQPDSICCPKAYWSFDACDATDSGSLNYHGVIHGKPQCRPGVSGKGYVFDRNDFIEIPYFHFMNGFCEATISAWIKSHIQDDSNHVVFSIGDERSGLDPVVINLKAHLTETSRISGIQLSHMVVENTISKKQLSFQPHYSNFIFENQHWYMLTVVLDASSGTSMATVYVNDQKIYTIYHDELICIQHDTKMKTYLAAVAGGHQGWVGFLDEVRVYDRAFSHAEIQNLYKHVRDKNPNLTIGSTSRSSRLDHSAPKQQLDDKHLFHITLFDWDNDADLDAIITHHQEKPNSLWLMQDRGQYEKVVSKERLLFDVDTLKQDHSIDHRFSYQVRAKDRDHDGCIEAFLLTPIIGREQWIDNGQDLYLVSGANRILVIDLPKKSKASCDKEAIPELLMKHLWHTTWSVLEDSNKPYK